jgi:putative transposase
MSDGRVFGIRHLLMSELSNDMSDLIFKPGQNTPPHLFVEDWFYMLTGVIYKRQPLIRSAVRKIEWSNAFLSASKIYHWEAIAWVVLDNHYHAILKSPLEGAANLSKFVVSFHKYTARRWNETGNSTGRQVWWNYWDTCIRSEQDFINRLRYVFWNPVKHGLVERPEQYPFSNFKEFMEIQSGIDFTRTDEVTDAPEF